MNGNCLCGYTERGVEDAVGGTLCDVSVLRLMGERRSGPFFEVNRRFRTDEEVLDARVSVLPQQDRTTTHGLYEVTLSQESRIVWRSSADDM